MYRPDETIDSDPSSNPGGIGSASLTRRSRSSKGPLLWSGHEAAVSFNDDSSPDTRTTSRLKVSINAQVIRENSLEWFYRILRFCEGIQGELKSGGIWVRFQNLPSDEQARIWAAGLSRVRIHVVDPRPYKEHEHEILRRAWRRRDAPELLRQMKAEGVPGAKQFLAQLDELTAGSILYDSTAVRVHTLALALGSNLVLPDLFPDMTDNSDQITEILANGFGPKPGSMVRDVTTWSAKSAATFHLALDSYSNVVDGAATSRFVSERIIRRQMANRVLDPHAFDEGNQRHIDLLESARSRILIALRAPEYGRAVGMRKAYAQVDSGESYFGQAADIATGIASRQFELGGLLKVVSNFEYVSYNGTRISMSDAEEQQRRAHRDGREGHPTLRGS